MTIVYGVLFQKYSLSDKILNDFSLLFYYENAIQNFVRQAIFLKQTTD